MLAEMSLTEYRHWAQHIGKVGFAHKNQELLLQQLNASVFNATGHMNPPLRASDFALFPNDQQPSKSMKQAELTEMLGMLSSK